MKEIWKDVKDYEGYYQISNLGNVKSLERYRKGRNNSKCIVKERILKETKGYCDRYKGVLLCNNGIKKKITIHRLVAQAFVSNLENKPCVNHLDGNKLNNNVKNLEWCTYSENDKHAYKIGLRCNKGEKNSQAKLTEREVLKIRELYKTGKYTQKEIGNIFNNSHQNISGIINRKRWKYI